MLLIFFAYLKAIAGTLIMEQPIVMARIVLQSGTNYILKIVVHMMMMTLRQTKCVAHAMEDAGTNQTK